MLLFEAMLSREVTHWMTMALNKTDEGQYVAKIHS